MFTWYNGSFNVHFPHSILSIYPHYLGSFQIWYNAFGKWEKCLLCINYQLLFSYLTLPRLPRIKLEVYKDCSGFEIEINDKWVWSMGISEEGFCTYTARCVDYDNHIWHFIRMTEFSLPRIKVEKYFSGLTFDVSIAINNEWLFSVGSFKELLPKYSPHQPGKFKHARRYYFAVITPHAIRGKSVII